MAHPNSCCFTAALPSAWHSHISSFALQEQCAASAGSILPSAAPRFNANLGSLKDSTQQQGDFSYVQETEACHGGQTSHAAKDSSMPTQQSAKLTSCGCKFCQSPSAVIVQVIRPEGGFSSELVQHEDMVDVCKPRPEQTSLRADEVCVARSG